MLAEEHPDRTAIVFAPESGPEREISWGELDRWSNRLARLLAGRGVGEDSTLVVDLPNSPEHYAAALAGWKLGAMVVPINAKLPTPERDVILEVAAPTLVVTAADDLVAAGLSSDPLPDVVPHPGKAITSGGSTGRPKLIVDPNPSAYPAEVLEAMIRTWAGVGAGEVQLVSGPLHHNAPFSWSHLGLFLGHLLVLMPRFDADRAVGLIEKHRVTFAPLVPTTMQRILLLPDLTTRDLSSLRSVFHTAAPCPAWVKRGWIDLIGADRIYEIFGATEAVGVCVIRGDEWLRHPGSVGRPTPDTELRILDDDGNEVPTGEVGEIFMRRAGATTYEYKGSPPARTTPDGFASVGDMGRVDAEGYLFLADRRADMIITGGANVYPAEIEMVLAEHPAVFDSAVVGLPSDDWGKSVHAIVQPRDPAAPPGADELARHCREHLAAYKVPKSWELVDELPRDEAGKVRRSALAAERAAAAPAAPVTAAASTPPTPPVETAVASDEPPPSRNGTSRLLGVLGLLALVGLVIGGFMLVGGGDDDDESTAAGGVPALGTTDPRTAGMDLSGEPSRGPKDAPIVIVEFTDYACEFCARFHHETFAELLRRNQGRVRYVVRNFPLADIHPTALKAAEAAECAHAQGKFWEYHERLFAAAGNLALENLKQTARTVGLDGKKFDTCLDSGAMTGKVTQDTLEGQSRDVRGTPTFFVNGRKTEGAKPIDHFQAEIEQATAAS